MKHLTYIALFVGLCCLTIGCQEEIDLDLPPTDPELVIEGYLTQRDYYIPDSDLDCFGQTIIPLSDIKLAVALVDAFINIDSIEAETDYFPFNKVRLTTTADYFSNSAPPPVSNASVVLYEDGVAVETLEEDQDSPGTYRFTYYPIVGATYHLEIQALGKFL